MTTNTLVSDKITRQTVETLSAAKGEPEWMLDQRLRAWRFFEEMPWPTGKEETWRRTRLTGFDLDRFVPMLGAPIVGGMELSPVTAEVSKSLEEVESAGEFGYRRRWPGEACSYQKELTDQGVVSRSLEAPCTNMPSSFSAISAPSSRPTRTS